MVVGDIVSAPHPVVRGDRYEKPPAGGQPLAKDVERADILPDVLEDVEQDDRVEPLVGVGDGVGKPPIDDVHDAACACTLSCGRVELEGPDRPVPRKERKGAAAAGPGVEKVGAGWQAHRVESAGDERAAPLEPPVAVLDVGDPVHEVAVHGRRRAWRALNQREPEWRTR